ncbi:MAG: hypothetical protein OJF49_002457 [Ktedonobacterales bacterium]|nr:MAG: hypothetical protein OJF49_002457 [Ktedonobacterales bacterium]
MTERLRRAMESVNDVVERAEQLNPEEQDALAARIEAMANELRWDELLNDPHRTASLDALAGEALADFEAGKTQPLR